MEEEKSDSKSLCEKAKKDLPGKAPTLCNNLGQSRQLHIFNSDRRGTKEIGDHFGSE